MDTPIYQDLCNDIIFKRFMGRRENKQLLISMLNLVIEDFKIVDLTYLSPEITGFDRKSKNSRMDLMVQTDNGTEIDIEVQMKNQHDFGDRAVYYAALPILQEIRSGDTTYHLTSRYVLAFLHFKLQHEKSERWKTKTESRYEILEKYTHEKLSGAMNFIFVELGRFRKKSLLDIDNDKERFYFCLLHMKEFTQMPEELKGIDFFERLFKAAEFEALEKDEKNKYIRFMTTERDLINQLDYAVEQGHAKGMAKGRAEGKAEGKAEAVRETASNFKKLGISVSDIAKATGLSETEIQKL